MRANVNKTSSRHGQVIESSVILDSNMNADLTDQFIVFKDSQDNNLVRIHKVANQLMYQIYDEICSQWGQDIPLTIGDIDQLKNLPVYANIYNNNDYARYDDSLRLFDNGAQYIRLHNNPPSIRYTDSIRFQREADLQPKLLIDTALTTSYQQLDMNSQRISSVANPTTATDAVNRQFLDKYDYPIGGLLHYWGYSAPDSSWLICNGTVFSQAEYPDLYAFLGNSNVLPNLQGAFLRASSDGVNPSLDTTNPRAVRTYQADDNKAHVHSVSDAYWAENQGGGQGLVGNDGSQDTDNDVYTRNIQTGSTGTESRPKNYAVLMLIKARSSKYI